MVIVFSVFENCGVIAIHRSYPKQMQLYWDIAKATLLTMAARLFKMIRIEKYEHYCNFNRGLDWRALIGTIYGHEPKPCWERGLEWPSLKGHNFHKGTE